MNSLPPQPHDTPGDGSSSLPSGLPRSATDEQLLLAHRNGDPDAIAELIKRYERELFHFLVRFTGDRAAAEDIFQEAFLQVHQSSHQFDTSRRFKPWLFTIAANKARDYLRSASRRSAAPLQAGMGGEGAGEYIDLLESPIDLPGEQLSDTETRERVRKVVMSLPDHLREILLLSYFQQFPYKQISEMLEIPLGTVKSRLHAAVAQFAERWKSLNRDAG